MFCVGERIVSIKAILASTVVITTANAVPEAGVHDVCMNESLDTSVQEETNAMAPFGPLFINKNNNVFRSDPIASVSDQMENKI